MRRPSVRRRPPVQNLNFLLQASGMTSIRLLSSNRRFYFQGSFLNVTMQQGIFKANFVTSKNIMDTGPKYSIKCRSV